MVLGTIMEVAFLLLGIFSLFKDGDRIFGLILIGIVILLWLVGFLWDKRQYGDWFYSWKQLSKLWRDDVSRGKDDAE